MIDCDGSPVCISPGRALTGMASPEGGNDGLRAAAQFAHRSPYKVLEAAWLGTVLNPDWLASSDRHVSMVQVCRRPIGWAFLTRFVIRGWRWWTLVEERIRDRCRLCVRVLGVVDLTGSETRNQTFDMM